MPPPRMVRQRAVTNENDENGGTTRLTRAKAAALAVPEDTSNVNTKKPLQSKKSAANTLTTNVGQPQRKRAALGDVSNVAKVEPTEEKDVKKALGGKVGLVSKASQNAGVQKMSRTNSSRSILGAKDNNKKTAGAELKRPASGSGVLGGTQKKRNTSSASSQLSTKEETPAVENVDPQERKIVNGIKTERSSLENVKEEVKREIKEEVKREVMNQINAEADVKQEMDVKQSFAEGVPDLDAEDIEDPLMVAEYVAEIFEYLKVLEETTLPNPEYMEHQDDLEWKMRGILVDWLIEVHTRFHLLPETLFLAVNIIDRFLSAKVIQLDRLQLVGVTAMFIASKYEEVLSPHVQNFRHVADNGFTEAEILSAERYVLSALNYDLSYPNPMNFLRRISKADNYDIQTRTLGKYLLEISLLDHRFMEYLPSHIAAASMYLARLILERGPWDATLSHYSGYTEEEIQPVFKLMIDYLHRPVQHEAFFKKYASKKFLKGKSFPVEMSITENLINHMLQLPSSPVNGPKNITQCTSMVKVG
ncbi:MAG: G2/mitotic-specific cyclin [Pycnora praestabilis]|nr:MAG: G2/mitotic-specific cyclin [Pycnora praestabilis]